MITNPERIASLTILRRDRLGGVLHEYSLPLELHGWNFQQAQRQGWRSEHRQWPVLLVIVIVVLALLYWSAPNVRHPGFRWITPGSTVAVIGWLAGVIAFLVWLWITNIAVLLGVEFDAEIDRGRALAAGHPADQESYVEPRDTCKMSADEKKRILWSASLAA
ncbi:YhjD/YihY/BrkB family envelope integrity protein [Nonomuraea sp. JJY05]|jgi:uncharacterized BrkB/YihY/UPF0761 family membrane protein|uniref:YhjD/YihY/BrkB family envelope integrity protein n=1 Tax=Nonomuraea sp. JJY05 TaxID=3350255 RepID=UPI00373F8DF8